MNPPAKDDPYGSGVLSKDLQTERARLELLEQALDPLSRDAIVACQLDRPPQHVIDVAAGCGSVSRWMATQFPAAQVVAADIDPRFLRAGERLTVAQLDVRVDELGPELFDIVHARYLLQHLPERTEVLRRLRQATRPGGWLVLVEGYWFPRDQHEHPVWGPVNAAMAAQVGAHGADLAWARRLPAELARLGMESLRVLVRPKLSGWPGWEANHDWWRATADQLGDTLVRDGRVEAAQLQRVRETPDSVEMADWFGISFAVIGRVPI